MIIDTHCHFDMMPNPEAYISAKEKVGDIVIGMTNLPSHFKMGFPHVRRYKHIRLALGLHPLLASENKNELPLFNCLLDQTSYIEGTEKVPFFYDQNGKCLRFVTSLSANRLK